jgi:hypothetical protein
MPKGRRGYYKQPCSVWREPWTNDQVAALVRIQAYLEDRWAREGLSDQEAGRADVPMAVLKVLMGKHRADFALISARHLADIVSISIEDQGDLVSISWPKCSEFQHNYGRFARDLGAKRGLRVSAAAAAYPPIVPQGDGLDAAKLNGSGSDLRATARAQWPLLQAAARQHGRHWRQLSTSRLELLTARLRENHDPQSLLQAIEGAIAYWRNSAPADADIGRHLVPETVYRRSNFTKYVEAAMQVTQAKAAAAARPRPFDELPPHASAEERKAGAEKLEALVAKMRVR